MNVCQVCGGPIHPLAGRCKHCKADLSTQRNAEAQARRRAATPIPAPLPAQPSSEPTKRPIDRAASQPAPMAGVYVQQPAGWKRRWPIAVGAIALVAISVSGGILIERARSGDKDKGDGVENKDDKDTSPELGGPQGNKNHTQPHASLGSAPDADRFYGKLVSTVCSRLNSCGMLNDFSKQACEEIARASTDPSASAKVKSGKCTYDKSAALACLTTVRKLKCDMTSANLMDWVNSAGKLSDCTSAFSCR